MEEDKNPISGEERAQSRSLSQRKFRNTASASFYSNKSKIFVIDSNPIEQQKKKVLKKILYLATIPPEILKALKRLIEVGPRSLDDKTIAKLREKAVDVMEGDRLFELDNLICKVIQENDTSYETILGLFKLYLLTSEEKDYVEKIDEELSRSFKLEDEIGEMTKELAVQREKKSKSNAIQESADSLRREIELYESRIEKANQKLNETNVRNSELRKKVDHLRKDKLLIEDVYNRLERDMKEKQEAIDNTIQNAGDAYLRKNKAEEELRFLNEHAEEQKEKFFGELQQINRNIDEVKHFKEFIFNKNKGKQELDQLEVAIVKNQIKIEEKTRTNAILEEEYNISAKKEEEILSAFERLKHGTGSHTPQDVGIAFYGLFTRVDEMEQHVQGLTSEIKRMDERIKGLKNQLKDYSLKGVEYDKKGADEAEALLQKLEVEEKNRKKYKGQYRNSIQTLSEYKESLEKVFLALKADDEVLAKIRNHTFTEQNIMEFVGLLEDKGITLINKFSRLIAEQIKMEMGDIDNNDSQIEDLNNIVAYDNANIMSGKKDKNQQLTNIPDEVLNDDLSLDKENPLTEDQFRQTAYSILNSSNKKQQSPKSKRSNSARSSKFNSKIVNFKLKSKPSFGV